MIGEELIELLEAEISSPRRLNAGVYLGMVFLIVAKDCRRLGETADLFEGRVRRDGGVIALFRFMSSARSSS